jgi:cytochrome c556
MAELERAARGDWPQELEGHAPIRDPGADPCLAEAVEHASALAQAALRIPAAAARANLPEVDRRAFFAQAETLYDQASRLEEATRQVDAAGMRVALNDIDATCLSCHTRFRDLSGALRR